MGNQESASGSGRTVSPPSSPRGKAARLRQQAIEEHCMEKVFSSRGSTVYNSVPLSAEPLHSSNPRTRGSSGSRIQSWSMSLKKSSPASAEPMAESDIHIPISRRRTGSELPPVRRDLVPDIITLPEAIPSTTTRRPDGGWKKRTLQRRHKRQMETIALTPQSASPLSTDAESGADSASDKIISNWDNDSSNVDTNNNNTNNDDSTPLTPTKHKKTASWGGTDKKKKTSKRASKSARQHVDKQSATSTATTTTTTAPAPSEAHYHSKHKKTHSKKSRSSSHKRGKSSSPTLAIPDASPQPITSC
eukprot:TRINITY_DN1903_c1_g2_i1.p1 TRINITY_DN1903_c1_g2~~TRINITY_DN1903_c1_g2_i1.p1  ORF type:complete len:318 (-),score=75.53 TRINITY_DN1903_c1_g2_i1:104-1015(-)